MAYFGKEFNLVSQENFAELVATWRIPDDLKDKIVNSKPNTIKLEKDGDSYTFHTTSYVKGGIHAIKFKSGVEFEEPVKDGLVSTNLVEVDGDTYTHTLKTPDGKWVVFKRQFSDSEVVVTITSSDFDGVAKRIYKA